jgi:DNA-directed RNA polymerase subunit RPC12/RpoP
MPFKTCTKCGKQVRIIDPSCWNCGSSLALAGPRLPGKQRGASATKAVAKPAALDGDSNTISQATANRAPVEVASENRSATKAMRKQPGIAIAKSAFIIATLSTLAAAGSWLLVVKRGGAHLDAPMDAAGLVACLSTLCALWGWLAGVSAVAAAWQGRKREGRRHEWPENDLVSVDSPRLAVKVVHIISTEESRPFFSNSTYRTTKYYEFPVMLRTYPSWPEPSVFDTSFRCPACSVPILVYGRQKTCVLLTPDDFILSESGRDLSRVFMIRRTIVDGLWCVFCLLVPSALVGLYIRGSDRPVTLTDLWLILGIWITTAVIGVGMIALRHRNGPKKPALFLLKGPKSILWRVVSRDRFFNLITGIGLTIGGGLGDRDSRVAWGTHFVSCASGTGNTFSDAELKRNYQIEFDRSYSL